MILLWHPPTLCCTDQQPGEVSPPHRHSCEANVLRPPKLTSQLPIERWYEIVGDPTLADAILDRVVHNAYRIELKGDSLRKRRAAEMAG
jgi:IstB-like ATP binding protein